MMLAGALLISVAFGASQPCEPDRRVLDLTLRDSVAVGASVLLISVDELAPDLRAAWVVEQNADGLYFVRPLNGGASLPIPKAIGAPTRLRVRGRMVDVVGELGVASGDVTQGFEILELPLGSRERVRDFLETGPGEALVLVERLSTFSLLGVWRDPEQRFRVASRTLLEGHGRLTLLGGTRYVYLSRAPWRVLMVTGGADLLAMPGDLELGLPVDYRSLYSQGLVELDCGRWLHLLADLTSTRRVSLIRNLEGVTRRSIFDLPMGVIASRPALRELLAVIARPEGHLVVWYSWSWHLEPN